MVSIDKFIERIKPVFERFRNNPNVRYEKIIRHIQNETSIDNLVVLVIDSKEKRFGQIGKLLMHDLVHEGIYWVKFKDGYTEDYPDGKMKGDPKSPVRTFYRLNDERLQHYEKQDCGLTAFRNIYLGLNVGNIEKLKQEHKELFGEELSLN